MITIQCPNCGATLGLSDYYEGEDEKSDGRLYPYALYGCRCGHTVHDYDDEFEYQEDWFLHLIRNQPSPEAETFGG